MKSGKSTIQARHRSGVIERLQGASGEGRFFDPAWSRSGRLLAFGLQSQSYSRVAIVREDGSFGRFIPQPKTDSGLVRDSQPAWAPTGYRVVFRRYVESGPNLVGVEEARAASLAVPALYIWSYYTGTRRLAKGGGEQPAWSIKNQIVFTPGGDLYLVRPNGKGLKRLTGKGGSAPNWSPTGKSIAFQRKGQVYRVRRDGKRLKKLTSSGGRQPVWSTNGQRIVYEDDGRIYSVRALGGKRSLLVSVKGGKAFSPDEQPRRKH